MDFSIVLPKAHPDYKTEYQLFREMLRRLKPPEWAKLVVVTADAAFASEDNMRLIQQLNQLDPKRRWDFVFAIARTWNMENGKSLSSLVSTFLTMFFTELGFHT